MYLLPASKVSKLPPGLSIDVLRCVDFAWGFLILVVHFPLQSFLVSRSVAHLRDAYSSEKGRGTDTSVPSGPSSTL
jgi:hypothetical protein